MELKLVGPSPREYHGHVVGSAEHGLALELVVRSIEDNAAAPSFIEVRGGRGVQVEASPTPHELIGAPDAEPAEGPPFVRSRLMRRGETLFYPFVAKPESPDWAVYRRLEFDVREIEARRGVLANVEALTASQAQAAGRTQSSRSTRRWTRPRSS